MEVMVKGFGSGCSVAAADGGSGKMRADVRLSGITVALGKVSAEQNHCIFKRLGDMAHCQL